jgi:hypothetical protein
MTKHRATIHHITSNKTHHNKKEASTKRSNSHTNINGATIVRGILTSFNNANYTANVLLLEATSTYLQNVPIAYHMDGTSALVNNQCAVLFFDEQNYSDALIIAIYPGAGVGAPPYPPGRITFIPFFNLINSVTIPSGTANTYTIAGANGIPSGALAILLIGYFTSPSTATYVQIAAHGAISALTMGNLYTANGFVNADGMVPLSSDGKIDVKANAGDCTVTLNVYGYIT